MRRKDAKYSPNLLTKSFRGSTIEFCIVNLFKFAFTSSGQIKTPMMPINIRRDITW